MDINFGNLSDRDIAERLYKAYGCKFFHYAITSWQLNQESLMRRSKLKKIYYYDNYRL